ncbi:MAG: UDP-N-acetylmuramoyl-tripeptide--D-alanyl-D-alanine ligase [Crocinitomicaceae bacterium]|nr:UDP-N-acetylmuramoyl-tripeptide--D-alanyl-D-alanine ligase [Crocinitomicaceae bacterium]|tara:strand:+ start:3868 stop:5160 length:1293 start_codon:yes stop_codon:yes gene_type:complete
MYSKSFEEFYKSSGISTDTRAISKDCLFVCIKGENFDGNTFASTALKQGARHVIVDDKAYFTQPKSMTLVTNSVTYLQELANFHRKKFKIPVIGVTGSNGKTTTKELIQKVLAKKYKVLATIGNLNNHLGVPFTLLRLTEEHDIAIIEMGANKFKDIEELCDIAEPSYGIITNIGKAHLEGFIDFDGVLKTKRELYGAIEKVSGTIVVNQDDNVLVDILPKNIERFTYGTNEQSDILGNLVSLTPFVNMTWKSESFTSSDIETKMVGKYNFYNYLAAVTFGKLFDVSNNDISKAIEDYTPTNNRSQVSKTDKNTIILDCYNANPTSMRSALESFAMIDHADKVFILGDMKELGNESHQEHKEIIDLVEALNLNGFTVGDEFHDLNSENIIKSFQTTQDLIAHLSNAPLSNKLVLLKGSRSIGLEKSQTLL